MRLDGREIARFLIAGLANTALTYTIYLLLLGPLGYTIAYTIAYATGIVIAYGLSTNFVFKSRMQRRSVMLFPFIYLVQYLVGVAVLHASVTWFGVPRAFAALVAIVCTIPITYVLSRFIIKERPSSR